MTRQIINLGTTPNDGTGDALRDAFAKVNDNFSELYTEFGSSNINISQNIISTTTNNQDLDLTPAGGGKVVIGPTNDLVVTSTTASTSGTTGALKVAGGIGAAGAIYSSDMVSAPSGVFHDITTSGGATIMGDISAEGVLYVKPTTGASAILPGLSTDLSANVTVHYDIGSSSRYFRSIYVANVYASTLMYQNQGFDWLDNTPIGPNTATYANFTTVNVEGTLLVLDDTTVQGQVIADWKYPNSDPKPGAAIVANALDVYDIGSADMPFRTVYSNSTTTGNMAATGTVTAVGDISTQGLMYVRLSDGAGSIQVGSAILPGLATDTDLNVDTVYDIGSAARRFATVYATTWGNDLTVMGNINLSGSLIGNLTGTASSAVTAGTSQYATLSGSATSSITSQTVTGNAQPNINSVGVLSSLNVSGTTQGKDIYLTGNLTVTGRSTLSGNVSLGTTLRALYGIVTDSANIGATSTSYTVDLRDSATHIVKMDISADFILNLNPSNISSGKQVTVIVRNTNASPRQVTLPNTLNNRNAANVNISSGTTAFFQFYTTGTTVNDVYVNAAGTS